MCLCLNKNLQNECTVFTRVYLLQANNFFHSSYSTSFWTTVNICDALTRAPSFLRRLKVGESVDVKVDAAAAAVVVGVIKMEWRKRWIDCCCRLQQREVEIVDITSQWQVVVAAGTVRGRGRVAVVIAKGRRHYNKWQTRKCSSSVNSDKHKLSEDEQPENMIKLQNEC